MKRYTCVRVVLPGIAASAAAALGATAFAGSPVGFPTPSHIVVVIDENLNYDQIVGNSTYAPYINNTLIPSGLLFSDSNGVEHPSQPNYLDFFSGSNQGIDNANATSGNNGDSFPDSANFNNFVGLPFTAANLASELYSTGKTFTEYAENLPVASSGQVDISSIDNPTTGSQMTTGYARRHDPVVNWISNNPTGNQLPLSADQPFTNFTNMGSNYANLPQVSLVIPNTVDDGHDPVNGSANYRLSEADSFLSSQLSAYVTWAKTNNSLLLLTWDENDNYQLGTTPNQIFTLMVGDTSLYQVGTSSQALTHYNFLRTIEDMYGTGYAGNSATASDLTVVNGQFAAAGPANPQWNGMGTTNKWSDSGNWANGTVWNGGQTAEFLAPGTGQTTYQQPSNYDLGENFGAILVDAGAPAITIGGGNIQMVTSTTPIINNSANTLTITSLVMPFLSLQSFNAASGNVVLGGLGFRNDFNNSVSATTGYQVAVETTGAHNVVFTGQISAVFPATQVDGLIVDNSPGAYTDITGTTNSWVGGATITSGTLLVSNGATGSATGSGNVGLNGGGLAGNGTIAGLVTMGGSASITAGGTLDSTYTTFSNTTGTLALQGGLNMNGNVATFNFDISGASAGTLNIGNTLILSSHDVVNILGTPTLGTYHLIDYSSLLNAADLSSWTLTGITGYTLVNDTANKSIDLTAVPDPASLALLALGALGLSLIRRRRAA
ncbi:MAG: alkaline phosphatase family protein [Phycisphaerae bacterium]